MKNVLETLTAQKQEVELEFGRLKQTQEQLQAQLNQVATRIVQLQGKYQQLEQLEKDFQDEPKEG
ncbi:unnamed protein product [marine sediment metagenome]|uniref:Uncharacterized protein n=1 Tax=marine sediment metagenome TaxID=412755 RepID=X0YIT2_9ZZZZ